MDYIFYMGVIIEIGGGLNILRGNFWKVSCGLNFYYGNYIREWWWIKYLIWGYKKKLGVDDRLYILEWLGKIKDELKWYYEVY